MVRPFPTQNGREPFDVCQSEKPLIKNGFPSTLQAQTADLSRAR